MRESAGKRASREYLFAECLPDWLSIEQIRKSNFLVLLSKNPRELDYTDALGVPRSQIYSVERLDIVFRSQVRQRLGVHVHFGELSEYLLTLLDTNQEFPILNLDVEGSYLSQLDSAMTPVLLLCWRRPETMIATYSSIGRDTEMLWEGVKSLAISLWLAPELTMLTFGSLIKRYRVAEFTEPIRMALRDFFWIRSMMEHTIMASAIMGVAAERVALNWFKKADMLWQSVARWQRKPLRLQSLKDLVNLAVAQDPGKKEIILAPPSCLGSRIQDLQHLVYNAEKPWSQLCYFTRLKNLVEVIDCRTWLNLTLHQFLDMPLIHINRRGAIKEHGHVVVSSESFGDRVLWSKTDLYEKFIPRDLGLPQVSPRLIQIWRAAFQTGKEKAMKKSSQRGGLVSTNGVLSMEGKTLIQEIARRFREMSTDNLIDILPSQFKRVKKSVVSANIAVGRRQER
jgi:hypothetical protein